MILMKSQRVNTLLGTASCDLRTTRMYQTRSEKKKKIIQKWKQDFQRIMNSKIQACDDKEIKYDKRENMMAFNGPVPYLN